MSNLPYTVKFKLPLQYLSVDDWNNFVNDLLFILQYGPGAWLQYYNNGNMSNLNVVKAKTGNFTDLEINGYQALWNLKPVETYTFPIVFENWLSDLQNVVNEFNKILGEIPTMKIPVYPVKTIPEAWLNVLSQFDKKSVSVSLKTYGEQLQQLSYLLSKFKYRLYTAYLETFPMAKSITGLQATISGSINLASLVPTQYINTARFAILRNIGTTPIQINGGIYLMPGDTLRAKIADIATKNVNEVVLTSQQSVPVGLTFGAIQPTLYAITIQNTQSDPTPTPFQLLLNLNLQGILSSASISNLLSLLFCEDQQCKTPLYAWIESYTSNLSSVLVWILLPNGISANSTITIYMQVNGQNNYPYTGIAPQLTPVYAQYDNANNIFPFYIRFGGLTSLPSGWTEVNGPTINFYPTYIQIAPNPSTGDWYGIYLSTNAFQGTLAWDFYGNMYDAVNAGNLVGPDTGTPSYNGYEWSEGNSPTNLVYLANDGNQWKFDTGYDDVNENKVYSMYIDGSFVNMLINYNSIFTTNSATSESPTLFNILPSNNGGSQPSTPIIVYWLRTRAYPPNGVMPSVTSFKSIS